MRLRVNSQNAQRNISQVPYGSWPGTGPNTNATTNAATNPILTNNAPPNINSQNTQNNISQVPIVRYWPVTGPNNGISQLNTRYITGYLSNASGVRFPVHMTVPILAQPTGTNAATNNSAINNVPASINSNPNNVLAVNSNTNNNAAIVNSNANNASTNNSPSQHREIINVEDSDDDEILIDEIPFGQSSN